MKANLYNKLHEITEKRRAMEAQLRDDANLTEAQISNLKDQIKYLEGKQDGITFGIQEAAKLESFIVGGSGWDTNGGSSG